jgi:DNA-binding transcriptional LysR family regulator
LRVAAPPTFAILGPIVAEFLGRYPDVQVEMLCTHRAGRSHFIVGQPGWEEAPKFPSTCDLEPQ